MMTALLSFVLQALAVVIAAYLIPGVTVASFTTALVVAFVLGLLNMFVKPVLLLLTLPVNILTLGLFSLVISVVIIYMTASLVSGFKVDGFLSALLFSFVLSLVTGFLGTLK